MSLDASTTPSNTEEPQGFNPSVSAIREHRARQHADRILDQFAERFTELDYFPEDGDSLLFAMLTRLQQWPADTQIKILDEDGDEVAGYLTGDDESLAVRSVVLIQHYDGGYSLPDEAPAVGEEALFKLILDQLPASSELGLGGNFPGSHSNAGRVVTLREQIAGLARSKRALLFEAFMADASVAKSDPDVLPNPFLPLWTLAADDRSPVLARLHELNPDLPAESLEDLLRSLPLSEAEEEALLESGAMPEDFVTALSALRAECAQHRVIDGLLNTRFHDEHIDAKARTLAGRVLMTRLGRELVVVELGDDGYLSQEPGDSRVVLLHRGHGEYIREDLRSEHLDAPLKGTDSFYLTIMSLLDPEQRTSLGLTSEFDVKGLRAAVANLAIEEVGGWFAPETATETHNECLPDWLQQAVPADKLAWQGAVQAYSQAILEAQAPGLPDIAQYGEPAQLRGYAREKLRERLQLDHGLMLNPDEILVETRHTQTIAQTPLDLGLGHTESLNPHELHVTTEVRSLVDLCLQNLSITDIEFLLDSRVLDNDGKLIRDLTSLYIFGLVRDLDVGESYPKFLRARLLDSNEGKWCQERYAQVMQAQMRLDALEAKLAGDYQDNGRSPAGQEDRGYKWVTAVLDNPLDNGKRATVEGHPVAVGQVRINGITLDGLLLMGPVSRLSVPSFVVYTPQAPDGKCFRELNSWDEFREDIVSHPDFLEYIISLAPQASQAKVRSALTVSLRSFVLSPVQLRENIFETAYEAQVERVIASVDEQTSSTWEKNWESAWEIAGFVGDLVLLFTPFRIALPIAALRSLYALAQGVRNAASGDQKAVFYFIEAAFLLADGLPGPKASKIKSGIASRNVTSLIDPKKALSNTPEGLIKRTDGWHKGIYEAKHDGAASSFYVKHAGDSYSVRYDGETWRLIDPRRPDAYYQMPITFKKGDWTYNNRGLSGGKPKNKNKNKAAKTEEAGALDVPAAEAASSVQRYTLDLSGLEHDKVFKKLDQHIQEKLEESIKKVTENYAERGGGKFHGYTDPVSKEKIFTLDLTGMPSSKGRGAWRLQLKEGGKGVLVLDKIKPSH